MVRPLNVIFLATLAALCLVRAAASPIAGTWKEDAATLTVRETDGAHNGAALPATPLVGTQWDGSVLRFSVVTVAKSVAFEFRVTGDGKAVLRRLPQSGILEMKVPMVRTR